MKNFGVTFLLMAWLSLASCGYIKGLLNRQQPGEPEVVAGSSEIQLIADQDRFKFVPELIKAQPGQILKIKVLNQLKQTPIVFSVLKKDEDPIVNAFLGIQAGAKKNWAPPAEHVLAQSKILDSNDSQSFVITLPKEHGEYAFISSYPGQVDDFNGLIRIETEPKNLE